MAREPLILVDDRWRGTHGIARFGVEVGRRLTTNHSVLRGPRNALSPLDLVNPFRLVLQRRDLVFSPGFNAGLTRATQLLTLHDLIHLSDANERDATKTLYYDHVVKPAVVRAGAVLTVSSTSRAAIREWLGDAVDVIDVGNGCSDVFFTTSPQQDRNGVLYVGNLKPHKNPRVAFAAVAALPGMPFTVVTSDVDVADRLAAEHGITERTTVRTGVEDADLARLYGSAAALVMPSRLEGFGLPAAEALAMECPVVFWTGCRAVAEICEEQGVGVEDADDPKVWAVALQEAIDRGAGGARSRVAERYSWSSVAGRVDAVLSRLGAVGRPTPSRRS